VKWDGLTVGQQDQLTSVLEVLEHDEHAPTTIRARAHALQVHVEDSLVALDIAAVSTATRLADLGSGVGFPGLALAVALASADVSLIESQRRKCEFLERACAAATISNACVVCSRVEEWREGIERNDVVVARALAPQPVVLEYAAPLLRLGGVLVDWRGRRDPASEEAAGRAAAILGMDRQEIRAVYPFAQATDRHLHVFVKHKATPEGFPRRAGMARKRPLAG
jgi:16S rRNA (guanine527-N7)-methyltransferase